MTEIYPVPASFIIDERSVSAVMPRDITGMPFPEDTASSILRILASGMQPIPEPFVVMYRFQSDTAMPPTWL